MMTLARLTCLWPGLPRLWFRGQWSALAAACGFAALLNAVLAATLVWPEILPPAVRAAAAAVAAAWWVLAAGLSLWQWPRMVAATDGDGQQGLFIRAQSEYLKGNWLEAESCVRKLLRRAPRDAEALLLLAAIARRAGRIDEARSHLQSLARLESAARWEVEIRAERELLRRGALRRRRDQMQKELPKEPAPTETPPPNVSILPDAPADDVDRRRRAA